MGLVSPAQHPDSALKVDVRPLSAIEFHHLAPAAVEVYIRAMDYPPHIARQRVRAWRAAVSRPGFCGVGAFIGPQHPGGPVQLVGVAYGSDGNVHDWWSRQVRSGLRERQLPERCLDDYFELTEIHVDPAFQGHGLGSRLLRALLFQTARHHVLLSTPEVDGENNGAFRLYNAYRFGSVLREFYFTGDERAFAILGRRLPLEPP